MKKETTRKIFAFTILGLFLISFCAVLVSAAPATDLVSDWWNNNIGGWDKFAVVMTYIIAILIIGSFLSSVLSMFFSDNKLKWLASPLGYALGIGLALIIKPTEIFAVMLSFKSIGLSLLTIVPLAMIAFFSIRARVEKTAVQVFLGRLIWIAYLIFIIAEGVVAYLAGNLGWDWQVYTMPLIILGVNVITAIAFIFTGLDGIIAEWFTGVKEDLTISAGKTIGRRIATVGKTFKNIEEGVNEGGKG